jgi:23S rRNA pseudouridine2605 synthase
MGAPRDPVPEARPPLVRWLSKCRVASRTAARALVREGRVRVNGRTCTDGARRIDATRDRVEVDGRPVSTPDPSRDAVWWAVNKPRGLVTTTRDPEGRPTVMSLVPTPHAPGLAPVGRLDKASAGLLLLTDDAALAAALLDPATHVRKTYRVKVRGHPSAETLAAWRTQTLEVEGLSLGPMDVEVRSEGPRSAWLEIGLAEGRNRQIRRRLAAAGHEVEVLVRTAFGPLRLDALGAGGGLLEPGAARRLAPAQVARLRAAVSASR